LGKNLQNSAVRVPVNGALQPAKQERNVETFKNPSEPTGEYKEMLVRLMTRQIYAETATAEVFGRAISAAPNF